MRTQSAFAFKQIEWINNVWSGSKSKPNNKRTRIQDKKSTAGRSGHANGIVKKKTIARNVYFDDVVCRAVAAV